MPNGSPNSKWVPPALLGAAGFLLGLFGDSVDAYERVAGWFRDPPLPSVGEEYLMVAIADDDDVGEASVRASFDRIAGQVQGLRMVAPDWLEALEAEKSRALAVFCRTNEQTMVDRFDRADDAARLALIGDCEDQAHGRLLIGTYAIKSFDAAPLEQLSVEFAVLANPDGVVDAYDGFIDGELVGDPLCLKGNISGECMAELESKETLTELPEIGPGETLIIPIFAAFQYDWEADSNHYTDGLAPTPLRFPMAVRLGDRTLISASRPMHETPTLSEGFYEGRG